MFACQKFTLTRQFRLQLLKNKMPEEIKEKIDSAIDHFTGKTKIRIFWRIFFIAFASLIVLCGILAGGVYAYDRKYENKIYPGVFLGDYSLEAMTGEEVGSFISGLNNRLNKEGIIYKFEIDGQEKTAHIPASFVDGDNVLDIFSVDSDNFEQTAFQYGREAQGIKKYWGIVALRFSPIKIKLAVNIQEEQFLELLKSALGQYEINPLEAKVTITDKNPIQYDIVGEQSGVVFDYKKIIDETSARLSVLDLEAINIKQIKVEARVFADDLKDKNEIIEKVLSYGDVSLSYVDPESAVSKNAQIAEKNVSDWLIPIKNDQGEIIFELDREKTAKYLENYKYTLDRPTDESKFVMVDGRVKEFRSGSAGQQLNIEKTVEAINLVMRDRNAGAVGATGTVALIVETVEPKIKLADINNLGITAVLGAGTSTFYDSHNNRIKNIAHAVALLNGTIIAPGEEFSTTRHAGPFTLENGYLPEEVIKGNEIKKEVGGGMCQIGTTLFRMAMNSGMPITERTNHSLVVGYYADPVNKNPGTDATIYDPILDFKFLNDTGGYLLLETNIDYKKQLLTFTLWGKPDGRYGYYSHPLVSRWIPAGNPIITYSTNLAPGVQKCQNAFRGAVASFTYTRFTSTTEQIDRVFTSTYRALPKICVAGISEDGCSDPNGCEPTEEEGAPSADSELTPEGEEEPAEIIPPLPDESSPATST